MLLVQLRFQSVVCPSLPFSQPPTAPPNPVLPNPLSIFGRPLFLGKGPLFLWKGCSFRVRLDPGGAAGCSRWLAGWLGRGPRLLHLPGWQQERLIPPCLCLPPSLWWGEASAKPSRQILPGCGGQPGSPVSLGHLVHMPHQQGWLFSCHPMVLKDIKNCQGLLTFFVN